MGKNGHELLHVVDFIVLFSKTFGKFYICLRIQHFGLFKTEMRTSKSFLKYFKGFSSQQIGKE